jgi:hypothetical protein
MRKPFSSLFAIAIISGLAISISAQSPNLTGDWELTINSPQGTFNPKATFKQDGENLSGMFKSQRGELPFKGTVKGKDLKFSYTVKFQEQDLVITLSGIIDGDSIKGEADFGGFAQGDWIAKRATAAAAASSETTTSSPPTTGSGTKIDITGAWNFEVETQAGSGNPSFTFKQEGEKLTGKYKGAFGEADLTGTVKGNQVDFSFKVSGQIEGVVTYSGTIDGNTMKGKAKFAELGEGTFTAKKQ